MTEDRADYWSKSIYANRKARFVSIIKQNRAVLTVWMHMIEILCAGGVVLEQVWADNTANLFQDEGRFAVLCPSWTRHFNQR